QHSPLDKVVAHLGDGGDHVGNRVIEDDAADGLGKRGIEALADENVIAVFDPPNVVGRGSLGRQPALVDSAADRSGVRGEEYTSAIRGEDRNVLDTHVFGLGVAENRPRDSDVAEIEAEIDGGLQGMVDALDDNADAALGEIVQRGLELE